MQSIKKNQSIANFYIMEAMIEKRTLILLRKTQH